MKDIMNADKMLAAVNRLHTNASPGCKVRVNGENYELHWNGRNYETTNPDGSTGPEWNTRKVTVARKWLREYLGN